MTRILILAAALTLGACAVYSPVPAKREVSASNAYEDALVEATRSDDLSRGFNVPVKMHATMLTPAFREAFEQEHLRVYGGAATDENLLPRSVAFVVALTGSNLEVVRPAGRGELWSMAFRHGDAVEVAPERIENLTRSDSWFRYFFPYWTPWRQMYQVHFPLPVSTTSGTLFFRSVSGELAVTW